MTRFTLLRRKRTWLEILLIGVLVAAGIAMWPTAQCALGACPPRDAWCNGDCSQTCGATNALREIDPAYGWGKIRQNDQGQYYCFRNPNVFRTFPYTCAEANNCNFTRWSGNSGKTVIRQNGNTYAWQLDSRPPHGGTPGQPCIPRQRLVQLQCCTGASGGPPTPCSPQYDPPAITLGGQTPPYPLTIGQDPDKMGVDVTVLVDGGRKTNHCSRGPAQRKVTDVTLVEVRLSDATVRWIEQDLASVYPGAHVKDRYPLMPRYNTTGLGTGQAALTFHFDPLDPGDYEIVVQSTQDDGQTQETVLSLHVWLMEATIIH